MHGHMHAHTHTLAHIKQLVFVHASLPSLYYTLDEGETFTAVAFSQNTLVTTTVVYHPTRDGWIMMKDQFLMVSHGYTIPPLLYIVP